MGLKDIELADIVAVCESLALYVRDHVGGRSSRPALGKSPLIWLGKKLLGVESFAGRWTLSETWRKTWTTHGIDPVTREVADEGLFEQRVREMTVRKERLTALKAERCRARNGVVASNGAGTNGEKTSTLQPLTPRGQQEDAAMLRAIRAKMGAPKAPLKPLDPRPFSRPPAQARAPIPAQPRKESPGRSSCPYTNCS